jgi:hypothetical protein
VPPDERLHNAILSFAHGVNNDFDTVIFALRQDRRNELADDLIKLRDEWRDASQAAFESIQAPPYKLDDSTFEHLTAWCERETRTADEALELRGKMIDYVQSLPVEDAEYSIGHGWPHVRNLVEG